MTLVQYLSLHSDDSDFDTNIGDTSCEKNSNLKLVPISDKDRLFRSNTAITAPKCSAIGSSSDFE